MFWERFVYFYDELIVVFGKVVLGQTELLTELLIRCIFFLGVSRFVLAEFAKSSVEMDEWLDKAISLLL